MCRFRNEVSDSLLGFRIACTPRWVASRVIATLGRTHMNVTVAVGTFCQLVVAIRRLIVDIELLISCVIPLGV